MTNKTKIDLKESKDHVIRRRCDHCCTEINPSDALFTSTEGHEFCSIECGEKYYWEDIDERD
jgi:hypothetical protein